MLSSNTSTSASVVDAEAWLPVIDWPEYEVSTLGNVRRIKTGKILPTIVHGGYLKVTLCRYKGRKVGILHRLVALAHIYNPKPNERVYVNHIDGDKLNPKVSNLEWVTPRENIQHAAKTGLMDGNQRRSRKVVGKNVITGEEVIYDSMVEAGKATGANPSGISACIAGKGLTAGGHQWRLHIIEPKSNCWRALLACDEYQFEPDRYEISDYGEIRNAKAQRPLHPSLNGNGYYIVNLTVLDRETRRIFLVHRLVASAFLGPPPDGAKCDVDHIDGDPKNNEVGNLQWLTKQKHAEKTNGRKVVQLAMDGTVVGHYDSIKAAATQTDRSHQSICDVLSGRRRNIAGYTWKYAEELPKKQPESTINVDLSSYIAEILGEPDTSQIDLSDYVDEVLNNMV
jgi:hypothetical protein